MRKGMRHRSVFALFGVIVLFYGCRDSDIEQCQLLTIDPNDLSINERSILINGTFDEESSLKGWQWNEMFADVIKIERKGMQSTNAAVLNLSKSRYAYILQKVAIKHPCNIVVFEYYLCAEDVKCNLMMEVECINNKIQYINGQEVYGCLGKQTLKSNLTGNVGWEKRYMIVSIPKNTEELRFSISTQGEKGIVIIDNVGAYIGEEK